MSSSVPSGSETPETSETLVVCKVDELPPGQVRKVDAARPIAVFNVDGVFHAIDDTCSHANASLSEGDLEGHEVECPWHVARFDLRTGKPCSLPASKPVRTHAVEVRDDVVVVLVGTKPEWAA
ncbi:bifunctional 3-phenylpropionate/cinnamic acid dioxygenase ferredoxin subunit [Amycolatopsis sp.]|jgi:3-phenylpropionate/trans-cinnamate dioxygenase ferredoxin subunit|uniref:bifunctional 3-phenylpropionate/cinnamic acid dioxygenase ferredoxin subunit n=1 Tax=Amycolatopsis sp. TaxID=37632 RepID=UPI002E01DFA0|nr:bifunctional 3-phenylpropionate/cinnamic acid dioxygenase ferredoxin subunit [Amycolatopsis sp.]